MKKILESIMEMINSSGLTDKLNEGLPNYNKDLWKFVSLVHCQITKPIGMALLAIFIAIEAARIYRKIDGNNFSLNAFLPMIIKLLFASVVMLNLPQILEAIMGVGGHLIGRMQGLMKVDKKHFGLFNMSEIMKNYKNLKMDEKIFTVAGLLISWCLVTVATIIAKITVAMRFIELYILTAFGAIPISTLGNEELANIGVNYLKTYAGAVMQGVILFAVLSFFPILAASMISGNVADSVIGAFGNMIFFSGALIFAIRKTGQWSKAITGAF